MKFRRLSLPPGPLKHPPGPACFVLGSWADWESAYGDRSVRPRVDFRGEVVVAVHQGPCATGGFSVNIKAVDAKPGELVVCAEYHRPGPRDLVTLAPTNPKDLVALARPVLAKAVGSGPLCRSIRVTVNDSGGVIQVATTTSLRLSDA